MKNHYQLTDVAYAKLIGDKVTVKDLFKCVPLFDPYKTGCEINKVGLLYYVDQKGDFNTPPNFPHKKIARAIFDCLGIKDKIMVAEYIDYLENGDDDEE